MKNDISEIVNDIYNSIEPEPLRWWSVASSINSDEVKRSAVRQIVRLHEPKVEQLEIVSQMLFDRLSLEGINHVVDMDTEYRNKKKDGTLERERQRGLQEARQKMKEGIGKPTSYRWESTL